MIPTKTYRITPRRSKATLPLAPAPLEEIGGEPLAGSGFENETPEPGFTTDAAPLNAPADLGARRAKPGQA